MKILQEDDIFGLEDVNLDISNKKRQLIRVYVLLGPDTDGIVTHIETKNDQTIYKGYIWDMFYKIIKLDQIRKNYKFEFTFSEFGKYNYNQTIEYLKEDKYDIVLGHFKQSFAREKAINFTVPIAIDAISVFHMKRINRLSIFTDILKSVLWLILILIVVGIISGSVLYYTDYSRSKRIDSNINNREFLLRSIMTGIASFFGEMGFLSEHTSYTAKGVMVSVIIMMFAFIYTLFIQAEITTKTIEKNKSTTLPTEQLADKPILAHKGYAMAKTLEEQGADVTFREKKTNNDLFDIYIKDHKKYNGIVLSYCDGYPRLVKNSNLTKTIEYGFEPISLAINNRKKRFHEDINKSILYLREMGELKNTCERHYGNIKGVPVCSLH